jgi:TAT (twin-arginine translocation) pathway signal sequence
LSSEEDGGRNPFERVDEPLETPEDVGVLDTPWSRRTFLKAAALGTAAAALWQKGPGLTFSPAAAYADDLSGLNCTANDVRIPAPGQILNEPCTCTGTFNAQVSFPIINNTGTDRYCVTMHLCAGVDENGNVVVPAQDIIVGTIPAGFNGNKTVTIPNYPCGAGLVCFGAKGPEADGGFPKGSACPTGQCCTTVSWNVVEHDPCPDPKGVIKSKCRHQQICIQGRGHTTIACPAAGCDVQCGGSTQLTVCTTEPDSVGPFTFQLLSGGVVVDSFGPTTDKCHTFTVSPTADTTYTGCVIATGDDPDCTKCSGPVTVHVTNITVTLAVTGNEACNTGALTVTASPAGCTSYEFFVDGVSKQNSASNTFSYSPNPDTLCHTVSVTTSCSGCPGSASTTISQCVQSTVGCTA